MNRKSSIENVRFQWRRNRATCYSRALATGAAAFSLALSACGGGGGGPSASATSVPGSGTTPVISTQPAAQVAAAAGPITFSVSASGGAVTYQWQLSIDGGTTWSPIKGATSATYTISFVYPYMNGYLFEALVTGSGTTLISAPAQLTVNAGGPAVQTFAGSGTPGAANGTGTAASFSIPTAVAADATGNLYVADSGNNLIREISASGEVTTLAGSGSIGANNGTAAQASFNNPDGIAIDAAGNTYIADNGNNMIRKIASNGSVTTLAGSSTPGYADGTGAAAAFRDLAKIAVDASGTIYVADSGNNMIRKVTAAGLVTTLAGSTNSGSANGSGTSASFNWPRGVAVDAAGNVYVADSNNNMIRKISSAGVVTTLAGSTTPGAADGIGVAASFNSPRGLSVDGSGNVYVADTGNNEIRKITPQGVVTTLSGSITAGATNGALSSAQFNFPTDVAFDGRGDLFVADYGNNLIRSVLGLTQVIPYYLNLGTPVQAVYTFKAQSTGSIIAYYIGTGDPYSNPVVNPAGYTDTIEMYVNGVAQGVVVNDHTTATGVPITFGSANAGDTITFVETVVDTGSTYSSDSTANVGGFNEIYAAPFAGAVPLPPGVYIGFGDTGNGDQASNYNYAAVNLLVTNVSISSVNP